MTYGPRLLNTVHFVYSNKKEIRITFELILCCLVIKIKTINPSSKHEDEEKNNLSLCCYDKHSVTHGNVVCHVSRVLET